MAKYIFSTNYICLFLIFVIFVIFVTIFKKNFLYNKKHIQKWYKSDMLVRNDGENIPCTVYCFQVNNIDEWALVYGNPHLDEYPLVRIQSQCITGIEFDDTECDCKQNMNFSKKMINENPNGGILFLLNQEGKSHGGILKLQDLAMRKNGMPEPEILKKLAISWDRRHYEYIPQALEIIGVNNNIRIITRFNDRVNDLKKDGVIIKEVVPYPYYLTKYNCEYLKMKEREFNYNFDKIEC